ncbi:tetratricopeptide repeat protein [Lentzea sp. BCCO 10_0856]|uniref:Tetratricopeptide repeat protein n=1 Tax=Lentzea miocenica TaxID=3095431 RepID=A0ABU4TC92_9PSEU|nr:tetratricopeptide repeat protein [Lentzea sp. BCCO 10_0856]MDX8035791.1 tetratricopeptide repeat protein [Lentzea sp. BCCO 10_0856]
MSKQTNHAHGTVFGKVVQAGTIALNVDTPPMTASKGLPREPLCVGRDDQVTALLDVLRPGSSIAVAAVDGMAGIGKTTLVTYVAWQVRGQFPGGFLMIDMQGYDDENLQLTVAQALDTLLVSAGVPVKHIPPSVQGRVSLWQTVLAERPPTLLIVDNVSSASRLQQLIPGNPAHRLLVTSRHRLTELEGAKHITVPVLPDDACIQLLRHWLSVELDAARLRETGTDTLVELCGGLPLALWIVTAWLKGDPVRTIGDVVASMQDERTRLAELDLNARSVRAAFAHSYKQLSADEQRAFRLLGVNRGPDLSLRTAAHLFGTGEREARRVLQKLQLASLIEHRQRGRWVMHDLLRLFARELADDDQLCRVAARRLTRHYLEGVRNAVEWFDPAGTPCERFADEQSALMWMDDEWPNLVAMFAATTCQLKRDLAAAMKPYLLLRRPGDWSDVARAAVDACISLKDADGEARARVSLGSAYRAAGEPEKAVPQHVMALAHARKVGDLNLECTALLNLGNAHQLLGNLHEAIELYELALPIRGKLGDELGKQRVLINMAAAHRGLGDPAKAIAILKPLVGKANFIDPSAGIVADVQLGHARREIGELRKAKRQYRSALRACHRLKDVRGAAVVMSFLSMMANSQVVPAAAQIGVAELAIVAGADSMKWGSTRHSF